MLSAKHEDKMTDIEIQTRKYLAAMYAPEGPTVEVAKVPNLDEILVFARSKGWIIEDDGFSLSDKGIQDLSR